METNELGMKNWEKILKESSYKLPGNGSVVDDYKVKEIARAAELEGVNKTIGLFRKWLESDDCWIQDKKGKRLPDAVLDGKDLQKVFEKYIKSLKS